VRRSRWQHHRQHQLAETCLPADVQYLGVEAVHPWRLAFGFLGDPRWPATSRSRSPTAGHPPGSIAGAVAVFVGGGFIGGIVGGLIAGSPH
jgi:PTS system fructose-specific IIC component